MKTKSRKRKAPVKTVLVLRTCNPDMISYGGFKWPTSGEVSAPDWDPAPRCGGGLHGFLWGCGDASLASWYPDAKWIVVEVAKKSIVDLGGKVKFPKGRVLFCGARLEATALIAQRKEGAIMGRTATAGDEGTATAGYRGVLVLRYLDGRRLRFVIGYVGEGGIRPNTIYRLDAEHKFVEVAP